jgi:hypothetical protein
VQLGQFGGFGIEIGFVDGQSITIPAIQTIGGRRRDSLRAGRRGSGEQKR